MDLLTAFITTISTFIAQSNPWYVVAGAAVGFAVGVTGVGGGSLMTPLLLMFGFPPATAIGTDLFYAAITKSNGILSYHRQHAIRWKIMGFMAAGSIPTAGITIWVLHVFFKNASQYQHILTTTLGFMLLMTSVVLLLRGRIQAHTLKINQERNTSGLHRKAYRWTFITGLFLGPLVTLSSVGAGAFGTAILMLLYPKWRSLNIVGTDLAHAVPLTFMAGIGHIFLGHVDWSLLTALLIGSLPAIYLGARVASKLPDRLLQLVLAFALAGMGAKYAFFN